MPVSFPELRARDFSRLDAGGHIYLDYTGSGLYAESLVRDHAELLCQQVLGNPHSGNPASLSCTQLVDDVRRRILRFFDADSEEYEIIFTSNATAALKLVGESYPFTPGSRLVLTSDNHNSVLGIREYAEARGAELRYVPLDEELRARDLTEHLAGANLDAANLFVYPAQSNFSGVKHPLEWAATARAAGYDTFLDAAAFVPTNRLSLREARPDFACVSFYKMLGHPTGLGALLARRDALARLQRPWFGGGTVRFVSAASRVRLLYRTARGFEDGTLNFLGIASLPAGLDFLEEVGMDRVAAHVAGLTRLLLREMRALTHANGAPLLRIYGPHGEEGRGGAVAFNVLDAEGRVMDFRVVERSAAEAGISLRTGYFCNPGAAEFAFGHAGAEVQRCAGGTTPESFDIEAFSVCLGDLPVGAVRVSLGLPSNEADVRRFVGYLGGAFGNAEKV